MAHPRHKRDTNARRRTRIIVIAGSVALLATAGSLSLEAGSPADPFGTDPTAAGATHTTDAADLGAALERGPVVSRSRSRLRSVRLQTRRDRAAATAAMRARQAATRRAVATADTPRWATTDLNLWAAPGAEATQVGLLDEGSKVLVTGREQQGREEVVVEGRSRWVTAGYLSADEPATASASAQASATTSATPSATPSPSAATASPSATASAGASEPAGLSMEPCPDSSVESGLTANAIHVYRSVCHTFPQITSYGGWDPHGEHASGRALDIMTSDVQLGTAIAHYLQAHAAALHIYDIIWRQHIWTPVRASEGWRLMPDRGSITANHYDHVHVATY